MAIKGVFIAELEYVRTMWNIEYAKISMTNTCYFVAYGLVQVGLFFIIGKVDFRKLMIVTVPISAICSFLMGVTENVYQMWALFGLTGAFQASVYCGCNYMLTKYLPIKQMTSANRVMNLAYAFGTVISYGLSALCITYDLWRIPYFVLSSIFAIAIIIFVFVVFKASRFEKLNKLFDKKETSVTNDEKGSNNIEKPLFTLETKKKVAVFYMIDLTMAFLITSLYYCVMNYITSLFVDVHGMDKSVSVYVTIIAPIMIALGPMMTISLCEKHRDFIKNAILCSLILLPVSLLLAFFFDLNVWLSLVLCIIL
ncbi:MAG: MFS transporter [Clostridia bacterium]|nr:MFS transporter [Clostridia bacterium]